MLEESLRQMAIWRDEGLLPERFYISVNASVRQLRDHSLRRKIATGCGSTGWARTGSAWRSPSRS